MGIFFTAGERKKRAGVYQRYENVGGSSVAGAVDGICAITFRSNWGSLGEVMTFDNIEDVNNVIGDGGASGTVAAIKELFNGEAITVLGVRLGNGGTKGTATLKDTTSGTAVDAVTLTLKHEGNRAFDFSIRDVLGDETNREFVLFENNVVKEKITFPVSADQEVDSLIAAINKDSNYLTAAKVSEYEGTGKLALVSTQAVTPGTNPNVTNGDYSKAFSLLEPHRWNTICVDTNETEVHSLLVAYMNRVYQEGKMAFAVVGEPTSVNLTDRMNHAKQYNDYNVVYVGGGWVDSSGEKIEGYRAVARIAGMVASISSNLSLTHKAITNAVSPIELLTNGQFEQAIDSGMLTFSTSSTGSVWIENGITTLVAPDGNDDEGWKKIKRTKIRFELMTRASDSVEPLIGKINNTSDGRSNIIQTIQGLLNNMVAEGKLLAGATVEVDGANPPEGDSAWFNIVADDIDSLEKIYLTFNFRFSPNQA